MKGFIRRTRFNFHTWHRCIKHCAQRTTDPEQSLWQWPAGREVCQCYIASFETRLDTDQVRQQLLQTSFNILKGRVGVGVVHAPSSSLCIVSLSSQQDIRFHLFSEHNA